MTFAWLVEIKGPLFLHPARSNAGGGFTHSAWDAQRFQTKEAAEAEIAKCNLTGASAIEHGFCE